MSISGGFRRSTGKFGRRISRAKSLSGDAVILDQTRPFNENLSAVLNDISYSKSSVSRKLSQLNNFAKLLGVTNTDIIRASIQDNVVVRLSNNLLHPAKEIRAAVLRALRYLLARLSETFSSILESSTDFLIARCIDVCEINDGERLQAFRLLRQMMVVNVMSFPESLVQPLVSLATDGGQQSDRMYRSALAVLAELAVLNPSLLRRCCGSSVLLRGILDTPSPPFNQVLTISTLHLLSNNGFEDGLDIESILAPLTESHYRHLIDIPESQIKDESNIRLQSAKLSLTTILTSWNGLYLLCRQGRTGLSSLLSCFTSSTVKVQSCLLDILYAALHIEQPHWTDDFQEALSTMRDSGFRESWNIESGFVAAEAYDVLPSLSTGYPDLINVHTAVLLHTLISSYLIELLIELALTTRNHHICVQTVCLLGGILELSNTILPSDCCETSNSLPTLIRSVAQPPVASLESARRAQSILTCLSQYSKSRSQPIPYYSLYLEAIMRRHHQSINTTSYVKVDTVDDVAINRTDLQDLTKDEENLCQAIKDSSVLSNPDYKKWNWVLINRIFKWPIETARRSEELTRFTRRMVDFYHPFSNEFSVLRSRRSNSTTYTLPALQMVDLLLATYPTNEEKEDELGLAAFSTIYLDFEETMIETELPKMLLELVEGIVRWLTAASEGVTYRESMADLLTNKIVRDYFLLIGRLSESRKGLHVLGRTGALECLNELVGKDNHEILNKLVISSLDYTIKGISRIIFMKILSSVSEECRLYATGFLRTLLRSNAPYFSSYKRCILHQLADCPDCRWGLDTLLLQLYDPAPAVAKLAFEILEEACCNDSNLVQLIHSRPSLTQIEPESFTALPLQFLREESGLANAAFVHYTINQWKSSYCRRYVSFIETRINDSLTFFNSTDPGARWSHTKRPQPHVYIPHHLYGELSHTTQGIQYIDQHGIVPPLLETIHRAWTGSRHDILTLNAALWAVGHLGSTPFGYSHLLARQPLQQPLLADLLRLAEGSDVLSVRSTCLYSLSLLSRTPEVCSHLQEFQWVTKQPTKFSLDIYNGGGSMTEDVGPIESEEDPSLQEEYFRVNDRTTSAPVYPSGLPETRTTHANTFPSVGASRQRKSALVRRRSNSLSGEPHPPTPTKPKRKAKRRIFRRELSLRVPTRVRNHRKHTRVVSDIYPIRVEVNDPVDTSGHSSNGASPRRASPVGRVAKETPPDPAPLAQRLADTAVVPEAGAVEFTETRLRSNSHPERFLNKVIPESPPRRRSISDESVNAKPYGDSQSGDAIRSTNRMPQFTALSRGSSGQGSMETKSRSDSFTTDTDRLTVTSGIGSIELVSPVLAGASERTGLPTIVSDQSLHQPVEDARQRYNLRPVTVSTPPSAGGYKPFKRSTSAVVLGCESPSPASSVSRFWKNRASTVSCDSTLGTETPTEPSLVTETPLTTTETHESLGSPYMGIALPRDFTLLFHLDKPKSLANEEAAAVRHVNVVEDHNKQRCLRCRSPAHCNVSESDEAPSSAHKENRITILQCVSNLSSSIGVSPIEKALLLMKDKHPSMFQDVCIYSDICCLLCASRYRLSARRFIQEIFLDVPINQITNFVQ